MSKQKHFNGGRLKAARTYRGMTIAELAEKIGLQRQTISLYESSQIKSPEFSVIKSISDELDFPTDFFLEENRLHVETGSTYFRALLTTNKKYRNEQIQKMELLTQIYQFLKEYIDFPALQLPQIPDKVTAEEAAHLLRLEWNLADRPIDNIVYHVEKHGILVTSFETSTNDVDAFSQMLTIGDNSEYLIAYSKNKTSTPRIHFDIAHELGHILLHEWTEDIEALDKEDFREREQQAHSFAAAFLLPKKAFERDLGAYASNLQYYVELKKKWKVSISAMIRRAYNLGKVDYNTYQRLMRMMQKQGIKKQEPLDDVLITAAPSLFSTSVRMLLDDGIFSTPEFLDELSRFTGLSLYGKEIEFLLGLPKGTLEINNIIEFPLKLKTHVGEAIF
ncbi:MAG: XRE family transcriptional regulator [Candidatus Limiplasma sp.]|nr:XRE family transcriptional regulator [Candidatus Limiplasma sp.]